MSAGKVLTRAEFSELLPEDISFEGGVRIEQPFNAALDELERVRLELSYVVIERDRAKEVEKRLDGMCRAKDRDVARLQAMCSQLRGRAERAEGERDEARLGATRVRELLQRIAILGQQEVGE